MTGYENGCLPVLEEELEDLVSNWGTDEMLELMAQCEFALSHCDGRIEQLKARGMKRLYNIITGINRRNRMRVLDNIYQIQKISFDIQKILLRRIDWVNSGLIRLNDKLDTQTYWTQDVIKGLLRKMADTTIDLKLLHWQNEVKNRRMEDNRKYIEVSDGLKVLLIVSDLFDIVHNRTDLISGPYLETVLDNLALKETISVADFYEDIIRER